MLARLLQEPPFRLIAKRALQLVGAPTEVRMKWNASRRPAYLLGLVHAARQAHRQGLDAFSAIEFGVAGGAGLVVLQDEAAAVEKETGIRIQVYGFDMGPEGLPPFIGDHRDHPDWWQPGDFPMDVAALQARLTARTALVLGNVRDTAASFVADYDPAPVGFVAVDVDLYSSTRDCLQVFRDAHRMLWHVPMYFDDIEFLCNSRWGGELAAIEEFNDTSDHVKIDRWYGVRNGMAFPNSAYFERMFVAHDLEAVSGVVLQRERVKLALAEH